MDIKVEELKESNKRLEEFAYMASHDLKAPISAIKSYAYLVKKAEPNLNKETVGYLNTIMKLCSNAVDMIQDLLNISRLESKPKEFVDCSLYEIIEEAILGLSEQVNKSRVTVILEESLHDKTVYCDRTLLVSMFQNLISNGIKFNRSRKKQVRIGALAACIECDTHTIFVEDNGIGINLEDQKKIFEVFNRCESEIEGFGIGLSIVKRVLEVHGENIWLESKKGEGTTFFFNLRKGRLSDGKEDLRQGKGRLREVQKRGQADHKQEAQGSQTS